jgi:hypothetical protein
MPRGYTIATAALALGVSTKWLDNTLSHYRVPGVVQRKQGVARRLTVDSLLALSVVLALTQDFGSTVAGAISVAEKLMAAGGTYVSPGGVRIHLDLDYFNNRLLEKLEHAVEVAPLPRRGRPPRNTTGRLE